MSVDIGSDRGLQVRMLFVMFLLMSVAVLFSTVLGLMFQSYIVAVLVVLLMVSLQFVFGHKLAMRSYGAKEVSPDEYPELHSMVTRLSQQAGVQKPTVAVADTGMANAFAAGRSQDSAIVCVTTGLMRQLNEDELEAVVAHELAHIKNRDVALMTAAGALLALAGLIIRGVFYSSMGRSRPDPRAILVMFIVSVVTYVVSYLLLRALSRYREYVADRGASVITGNPQALASALEKIDTSMETLPKEDMREAEGVSAFMIAPVKTKINGLLRTHPPTEKRIERLNEISADI